MKKLFLLLSAIILSWPVIAQVLDENNVTPLKLSDIVAAHTRQETNVQNEPEEDKDYHFDRWLWYWQQHTDENGYLVSPMHNYLEWKKLSNSKNKTTGVNNSNWVFKGMTAPGTTTSWTGNNGVGRVNTMTFHPADSNTYWAGSASGGVWKTTDNGLTWSCLTDNLPVISVSDIDVNPKNTNTLYLCTGDRDARDHFSMGVLKSTNGGVTWDTTGLKWSSSLLRLTNCLVINSKDTSSLIAATSDGIYKSFNGGNTWLNVKAGNYKQVLYHPLDTNIVYATSFDTVSGNKSSQVYRSANGGMTWNAVTNWTYAWRIELAVTAANPAIVKAIAASYEPVRYKGMHGFYSSSDTGKTFTLIATDSNCTRNILSGDYSSPGNGCTGQGNYDLCLTIDPKDTSKVYFGGINTWFSGNGGKNWRMVTTWFSYLSNVPVIHADVHYVGFHPLLPGRLFEGNDGGLYYTDKPEGPGSWLNPTWKNISKGLGITQFYRNAVSNNRNTVLGGTQDNATNELIGTSWRYDIGGDGMECHYDYADTNYAYGSSQRGSILRRFKGATFTTMISNNIPGNPSGTGAWVTPFIINPINSTHLLAGYKDLFYTQDRGNTWTPINNVPLSGRNFQRIAMSRASASTIYATVEDSNIIYYTKSYTPGIPGSMNTMTPPYIGRVITDIKVNPKNADHFWVTFGGYNTAQVVEYKTGTWTKMNTDLPNVPVLCMEIDSSNGTLYVGTDVGVFFLNDSTASKWVPYNKNLPSVHVTDLGIHYKNKELWAATYGRGMWVSPTQELVKIDPPDTTDTNTVVAVVPFVQDGFKLYPNPTDGRLTVQAVDEQYFGREAYVRIADNTGRVVWEDKRFVNHYGVMNLNIESLPKAVYILELRMDNQLVGQKRVIVR